MDTLLRYVLLGAAACFVLGLHLMNSPATARKGNLLSAAAMAAAIGATGILLAQNGSITTTGWVVLVTAGAFGSAVGLYLARNVRMTAMPQLVSMFNAVGGGAAALIAVTEFLRHTTKLDASVPGAVDVLIGAVTFSGSLVAAGKLQGVVPGRPIVFPGARALNAVLAVGFLAGGGWLVVQPRSAVALVLLAVTALAFGVTMVLPIGGADMPVVISLLNAFTGT